MWTLDCFWDDCKEAAKIPTAHKITMSTADGHEKVVKLKHCGDYVRLFEIDSEMFLCVDDDFVFQKKTGSDNTFDDRCLWEFEEHHAGHGPSPGEHWVEAFFNHLLESKLDDLAGEALDQHLDETLGGEDCVVEHDHQKKAAVWTKDKLEACWQHVTSGADPNIAARDFGLLSGSWDDNKEHWDGINALIQRSYRFSEMHANANIFFCETSTGQTAFDDARFQQNHGIAMLTRDEFDRPWVFFPGATGLKIPFGDEGSCVDCERGNGFVHENCCKEWKAVEDIVQLHVKHNDNDDGVIFSGHS